MLVPVILYKTWKPNHKHAPVSGRVAFDGHRGGDESYVMIDLHNVSHLNMIVHSCMCALYCTIMLGDSCHPIECFVESICTIFPQFMIHCIA